MPWAAITPKIRMIFRRMEIFSAGGGFLHHFHATIQYQNPKV